MLRFLVLICACCSITLAQEQPAGTMKFTRVSVKDPGINNIEAVSFLIPSGWKTEGGVTWFPDYSILANLLMKVTDPTTGAQIEFLPLQKFTHITQPVFPMQPFSNYMGQIVHEPITNVPQFIQIMYFPQATPQLRNAEIVGQEDLKKVAEQVSKNYGGQSQVVAGKVRYAYEKDGQPWEEDVFVTLVFTPWQMGTMWSVDSAYAFRAPKGELDKLSPVMSVSIKTLKLSLDWFAGYMQVQKLFNNRMMQGIRDATALSKQISQNAEESRKMWSDAWKERNESQDRIHKSFGEYIKGVDTYDDPVKGQPVELPAGYKDAWVNPQGEYILSEQAGFNPNEGSTVDWKKMEIAK